MDGWDEPINEEAENPRLRDLLREADDDWGLVLTHLRSAVENAE